MLAAASATDWGGPAEANAKYSSPPWAAGEADPGVRLLLTSKNPLVFPPPTSRTKHRPTRGPRRHLKWSAVFR
ncbi:hypothetical protein Acsp04_16200 [Actinomadura sp. NBRC 104425]|nr:hypothetical protein Acsp04_16200 [Actinomadura sp. NBRC 104425]